MSTDQEIKSNVDGNSCRNCKHYSYGYGLAGNKGYPDGYIACIYNKKAEMECKHSNFSRWEEK